MFFMLSLFLSGVTAIPVSSELEFIIVHFPFEGSIKGWFEEVLIAVNRTGYEFPFLFYGYDWFAFAHFVLAILFIGPLRDPIRNKWVIEFGIIASLLVIPFALIAGHFRGMPIWWRLIDCSFGIIGLVPLFICRNKVIELEAQVNNEQENSFAFNSLVTES